MVATPPSHSGETAATFGGEGWRIGNSPVRVGHALTLRADLQGKRSDPLGWRPTRWPRGPGQSGIQCPVRAVETNCRHGWKQGEGMRGNELPGQVVTGCWNAQLPAADRGDSRPGPDHGPLDPRAGGLNRRRNRGGARSSLAEAHVPWPSGGVGAIRRGHRHPQLPE